MKLERNGNSMTSWVMAWMVAGSTVAGFIFPFCHNFTVWMVVMVVSWILYMALPVRLIQKRRRLLNLHKMKGGSTQIEKETYQRAQFAYKLMLVCNFA